MNEFIVHLPVFEGPLDLLLHLIERRELDITQVSLAAVTDEYLEYLHQLEEVDPARVASFLVIAARLLVIKSRLLLPSEAPPPDEDEEDEGEELVRALEVYRQFKQVAALLQEREVAGLRAYVREAPPPDLEPRLVPDGTGLADLLAALRRVLAQVPEEPESVDTVVRPIKVTVRECARRLTERLRQGRPFRFEEMFKGVPTRQEVIATFLALLELIRLQRARVRQPEPFAPIEIEPVLENLPPADADDLDLSTAFDEPPTLE